MKKWTLVISLACLYAGTIQAETQPDLGETLYQKACANCHAPHVAETMKAPKAFDNCAWRQIFQKAEAAAKQDERFEDGKAYLAYQVKIGKGLMHHGGLCLETDIENKDCSEKAYLAAIEYMAADK